MVTSRRRLTVYSGASLTAICIICVYVIYAGDVVSLRHVAMTAWEYVTAEEDANLRTDIPCSTSGIPSITALSLFTVTTVNLYSRNYSNPFLKRTILGFAIANFNERPHRRG